MPGTKKRSTHRNKKTRGQKLYKMSGCSTKKHLGGDNHPLAQSTTMSGNISNAYPNQGTSNMASSTLNSQSGGSCGCGGTLPSQSGGSYNNAFVGNAWYGGNERTWSGVTNSPNGGNHLPLNKYSNDVSRHMKSLGANRPFLKGGRRKGSRRRVMKGGINLSNTIGQDFVNLARQGVSGIGNMFNAYQGYAPSVSPMPYKNQLPTTLSSNALKIMKI